MSNRILHVCDLTTFIPPFVDFIDEYFLSDEHFFWLHGDHDKYPVRKNILNYKVMRTKSSRIKGVLKLVQLMQGSKKIILHGLFNPGVVLILFLMPWLLKRCYWVVWGGDLYVYQFGEKNWKWRIREFLRRPVIKNMGHLLTYIPDDVELARQWYGAKGEYRECLMYLSNVVDPVIIGGSQVPLQEQIGLNLMVGNSADPSNNHIESLQKLLPYKDEKIKIFVPLSYGDEEHAKKVIKIGKAWFGDKFVPITSFMASDEYLKFLKSVDIAIFNHKRQQGMGNTITLLGMGKTVYLRSDVSQWSFFKEKGITCLDIEAFNKKLIPIKRARDNSDICLDYFNLNTLRAQYSELFK